ncbi:MAG: helix-turn-helix domain-containing protein [Oligoflexus sp.]
MKEDETMSLTTTQMREAREAYNKLMDFSGSNDAALDFSGSKVKLPAGAIQFLVEILKEMSLGHTIVIQPENKMITTQEAADILNVSRPFVVRLLEGGKMPYMKIGTHRKIRLSDVVAYKEKSMQESHKAMAELEELTKDLGLDY